MGGDDDDDDTKFDSHSRLPSNGTQGYSSDFFKTRPTVLKDTSQTFLKLHDLLDGGRARVLDRLGFGRTRICARRGC